MSGQIISMQNWLETPPGQYLLAWERAQFDQVVADIFGYHALQLGLAPLPALQANRMPHRWLAVASSNKASEDPSSRTTNKRSDFTSIDVKPATDLVTDFAALPFFENSLDLLVLPHSLELSPDPHATLREAQRVLVPDGKLVICGFNPMSLWGMKQGRGHIYRRLSQISKSNTDKSEPSRFSFGEFFLPETGEFIGYRRLRDWLRLLNFEIESGKFGCYRPAVRSEQWLQRFSWMDKVGERYWPILGSVYFVVAVKRVHGMRMLSPNWKGSRVNVTAPVSLANKAHSMTAEDHF
ncbi:MAG: methyltransferase domain-containing protein [Cellvibrio sp.]|uniref:class I SAM-dependent methyltransferase n=1 Tax=Cellvibrio sp. TaxID=1965322 RepID=UPI00271C4262|nr:methyltransferase domain-containing protein [Cellvibrio sp.]